MTERQSDKYSAVADALRLAIRQNSNDMLLTGEELRRCEYALADFAVPECGTPCQMCLAREVEQRKRADQAERELAEARQEREFAQKEIEYFREKSSAVSATQPSVPVAWLDPKRGKFISAEEKDYWMKEWPEQAKGYDVALIAIALSTTQPRAIADVAAERQRQVDVEGWTAEHDAEHYAGDLAKAAACYAVPVLAIKWWPWDKKWWKPKDRRRDLVRAAALIVAEIERLDRTAPASATQERKDG